MIPNMMSEYLYIIYGREHNDNKNGLDIDKVITIG